MNVGGVKNKGLIFLTTHILSLAKPLLKHCHLTYPSLKPVPTLSPLLPETAISLCLNELLQVARGIDFAQY
jgi:hypothetical protein